MYTTVTYEARQLCFPRRFRRCRQILNPPLSSIRAHKSSKEDSPTIAERVLRGVPKFMKLLPPAIGDMIIACTRSVSPHGSTTCRILSRPAKTKMLTQSSA